MPSTQELRDQYRLDSEFGVRVEFEPDVESDPEQLVGLFWFCLQRVITECEARDLLPIGTLTVHRKPTDRTLPGLAVIPVVLVFDYSKVLADYWHEVARKRREAAGIPEPVRLEA